MQPHVRHFTRHGDPRTLSPQVIDAAIREGRRLQSQAVADSLRGLGRWLRRLVSAQRPEERRDDVASALTALRASAEALRDHPDITRDARGRLVDIVLKEEARLERLLLRVSGAPSRSDA